MYEANEDDAVPELGAVAKLEARIAALEAQLVLGRQMYRDLRDSQLVPASQRSRTQSPTVTYWVDSHGQRWAKTRTGNQSTSVLVSSNEATQ